MSLICGLSSDSDTDGVVYGGSANDWFYEPIVARLCRDMALPDTKYNFRCVNKVVDLGPITGLTRVWSVDTMNGNVIRNLIQTFGA